ncbi:hypothetical protein KD923_20165, partial [Escherichia fergusonii]|nr:hypothetical protein [Escherichia fergusonii]
MIINKEIWEKYFKGFDIYDCTYGFEHGRVGLALIELVEENHDDYDNPFYIPEKRLISISINNPPEKCIYGRRANGISLVTISSGWSPSNNEYVMVSQGRAVVSYKEDEYKGRENDLDISIPGTVDMYSAISKVLRVGTNIYAVASGFRIYKRIDHHIWQECSQSIPVPEGYTERKAEAITRGFFEDLAGFSESDM